MEYTNSAMMEAIDECVHNDRYRLVLKLRLIDGWTYERIAAYPDVDRSPRQICSIMDRYTPALYDYLVRRKTS